MPDPKPYPYLQSGRWCSNFNTYRKDSHNLWSRRMVFLGILDFSNGEGGSSMIAGENTERTIPCHISAVGVRGAYHNLLIN